MFWRVLGAIGALTFIVTGVQTLADDSCEAVTFGSGEQGRRVVTMTCWDAPPEQVDDAMSPVAGGLGSIGAGLGLLTLATWPFIVTVVRGRSPEDVAFERHLLASMEARAKQQQSATVPLVEKASDSPKSAAQAVSAGVPSGQMATTTTSDNPLDLLDDEIVAQLARFRFDVDDLLATGRGHKVRDLPGDLPFAVLRCCNALKAAFVSGESPGDPGEDVRPRMGGLLARACVTGAWAGTMIRGPRLDSPAGLDRVALIATGMARGDRASSVSTYELLASNAQLDVMASHFAGLATVVVEASDLSDDDRTRFATACELAFADGLYLGLTTTY